MTENKDELYKKAQRRLVACLLCDDESSVQALEQVSAEDFKEPALGVVFAAAADVLRRGEKVSAMTIAECLEANGELEHAGGVSELYSLRSEGERYLSEAPITVYARIVREFSGKDQVRSILKEHSKSFLPDSGQLTSDAVSELQSQLNEILYQVSDTTGTSNATDLADEYLDKLDERHKIAEENRENASGLQGIPTSLPSLNEYTTGLLKGQMITVAAQTGVGKSIFAVNTMVAACQAGKTVMFFALEMERDEIENRIVSSITGVPLNHLKQGDLDEGELERVKTGLERVREMNFIIDSSSKIDVDMIRARALKQAQSPEGLDMVIIDYLQLITPSRSINNRQEQVAEISRGIKLLAGTLAVPVVVVVQLKRPADKEQEDLTPSMYDIRESGAIANDSDVVLILHRPHSEDGSIPHTRVILDKNRNGVANKVILCHSDLACSSFREIVRADEARMTDEDLEDLGEEFGELSSTGDPDDLDLSEFDDEEETDF